MRGPVLDRADEVDWAVGSYQMALVAKYANKPFYALAERSVCQTLAQPQETWRRADLPRFALLAIRLYTHAFSAAEHPFTPPNTATNSIDCSRCRSLMSRLPPLGEAGTGTRCRHPNL